ncbi:MAG: protein kinase family protein [Nocardioides sp.]|nr:protein kinase family protein [Nocardioides sp.]
MPEHNRPGDALADRYRLTDLLTESAGGRFWRAFDSVLQRDVAVHIISCEDERAPLLRIAARTSATVLDRRMLRVLDIDETPDNRCFVVNEWGTGTSLDILLAEGEPLPPPVAAWIVAETADTIALAHEAKVAHGRLVPENVLIDTDGAVRLIGFAVDAALHGLPAGRISTDVADLAGLLYAALTGKWAGVSRSAVPPAPTEHGHVLRPRQVRARIPRTLDSLCDHILNHGGDTEVSAAMFADALRDFIGPSAGAAEAWLARLEHPRKGVPGVNLPPLPDPPPRDANGAPAADLAAADTTEGDPVDTTGSTKDELATQAGMPIFHDDTDEVTWLRRRSEPAPPPPPLEPQPERPLFAPEPAEGQPVRRPRAAPVSPVGAGGGGFWPWENTGTGGGTGSGSLPAFVDDGESADRRAPGTNMLRLAGVVAVCLLVLVAFVIAFNLGRGRTPLGTARDHQASGVQTQTPDATPTPSPIAGVTAHDFDPQGTDGSENPEEAPNAVDGNPATFWQTSIYDQQFGPAGLKTGVGLVLDLGASHQVSEVDLTTVGTPTQVQIYVLDHAPTSLQGAKPAGRTTVTGTKGTVTVDPPATGQYVVVWLTRLPAADGGFRGGVAEAVVKGD